MECFGLDVRSLREWVLEGWSCFKQCVGGAVIEIASLLPGTAENMSLLRVMYKSRHVSAASSAFFHRKLCDNLPWTRHQIRTCSQQAANVSPIQNIQKPRELDITASSQLKGNIEKSTEKKGIIQRSLFKANVLIEELSHMDEVREAQDRVIQLKVWKYKANLGLLPNRQFQF